jgi:hypothetical protein
MARRVRVFELAFKQDLSGLFRQGGENLACTGDEPMQLERKECAFPRSAAFLFWQADAGQECLKTTPAGFDVDTAVF